MRSAPGCCSAMPDQIGLDSAFTIHDREDSADLLNLLRHQLGFSKTETRFPTKGTCLAIYSRCVNAESPIEDVLRTSFPWCAGWAQMMSDPGIAADLGGRFDHVLVDEYQDTNCLQASILLALKPDGCGLTVVGDERQEGEEMYRMVSDFLGED